MVVSSFELGNAIRAARMKNGLTQEKLAEMLDITIGHLQQMEGGRRNPSVPLLFQMMTLLELSVDALVFPERGAEEALHVSGLTGPQISALRRLVETIKQ